MSLKLNSSGGGSVTLQEPITASTLTLNLPATLGNSSASAVVTTDASGNLGLGVTPSAWGSGRRALELAGSVNYFMGANANSTVLGSNFYSDGTNNLYKTNGFASFYLQASGAHYWYTAPSGTAGNAITFTQAMTLDASSNLLLGTTSVQNEAKISVLTTNSTSGISLNVARSGNGYTGIVVNRLNSDGDVANWLRNGTQVGSISITSSATAYNTSSDYRLKNITGPITTSGAYIDSLNPVEGTWKADGSAFVGLIAHEVQEASRTPVATGTKDGEKMQGMDYSSAEIIANLIAELQSVRKRLAALESN